MNSTKEESRSGSRYNNRVCVANIELFVYDFRVMTLKLLNKNFPQSWEEEIVTCFLVCTNVVFVY